MTRDGRPGALKSSRRSTLAALGTVALAGCSAIPGWPSRIDGDRLAAIVDETERPPVADPFPLPIADAHFDANRRRVEALLEPIPRSIDADTVPNGEIRDRIESERERAHEHAAQAADEPTPRDRLERLRTARERAANAAGIWAAIDDGRGRDAVSETTDETEAELEAFAENREYVVGEEPIRAGFTHAAVDDLSELAADELDEVAAIEEPVRSLAVGEMTARLEAGRAAFESARHVHETVVDSVSDARTEGGLSDAAAILDDRLDERRDRLPDPLDEGHEYVDRDIEPDSTPARVLYMVEYDLQTELGRKTGNRTAAYDPARTVRDAATALVAIAGFERLRSRIDDGDSIPLSDASDVAAPRTEAIETIESLLADDPRPFEQWVAADLVERLAYPDEQLRSKAGDYFDPESLRYFLSQYYWIAEMAAATPDVADVVYSAFD